MPIKARHTDLWKGSSQPISTKSSTSYLSETRDEILSLCESNELDHLRGSGDFLWKVINESLAYGEISYQLWWNTTGSVLAGLLHEAGYHVTAQCEILLFYFLIVVPQLGPHPRALRGLLPWKSFMTDEHTPIELSWEWGLGEKSPMVRLSIEPIRLDAGTSPDPLNEYATNQVIDGFLHMFPSTELNLFHFYSKELLTYRLEHGDNDTALTTAGHQSRSFVAFDFSKPGPMLKAYFLPIFKARETGQSTLAIISQAIDKLAKREGLKFPGHDFLSDYLQTSSEGLGLQAEIFSIDCLSPALSRMKIYLRSQSTSFESIRANMTFGGKLKQRGLQKGIVELENLWRMVLLPARHANANEELPCKSHRTAGILYYYEIRPGHLFPTPRVYIPVRHYGENDMAIAKGLVSYLKSRGQEGFTGQYLKFLQTN